MLKITQPGGGCYFEEYTCKDEFNAMIRDLLPKGYWNGYVWEDDDSSLVFEYADGSYKCIFSGDTVGKIELDKIVKGVWSHSSGYSYYGNYEVVYNEHYEDYVLDI